MPLKPDEIKRRIQGARILRDMDQKELDRLGVEEGYGKGEMSRVERGEIEYRAGKHLDVLCRILRVPRWWFTVDELDFGGVDAPVPVDEVAGLIAHQNGLLQRQSEILERIEGAIDTFDEAAKRDEDAQNRLALAAAHRAIEEAKAAEASEEPLSADQPKAEARAQRAR